MIPHVVKKGGGAPSPPRNFQSFHTKMSKYFNTSPPPFSQTIDNMLYTISKRKKYPSGTSLCFTHVCTVLASAAILRKEIRLVQHFILHRGDIRENRGKESVKFPPFPRKKREEIYFFSTLSSPAGIFF